MGNDDKFLYEPSPQDLVAIRRLVAEKGFRDEQNFIDRALAMIIKWNDDPIQLMTEMNFDDFDEKQKEEYKNTFFTKTI